MINYRFTLVVAVAFAALALPASACEQHPQGHATLKSVDSTAAKAVDTTAMAVPAAAVAVPKAAAQPAEKPKYSAAGGYENCARMKKQQTVYLTQ